VPVPIGLFLGGTSCVDTEVVTTNAMMELETNIVTVCAGSIQGATNEQLFEIGRAFTITAKAPPGNIFAGWYEGGNLISTLPTYSLTISELLTNRSVTAHFNTNLFPHVKGTYTGLFCDTNQVEEWNSGFITLTVGDLGAYTAKVMINNKTFPVSGVFNSADGYAQYFLIQTPSTTSNDLFIRLNLDLRGGTDHLSGTVSNFHYYVVTNLTSTNYYTNQWVAELHADRPVFTTAMPAPQAGKYTLLIPADPLSIAGPFGDGYGTATINTKGSLTFKGALPDGTKVTQKVSVSRNGDWPLYLNLYKGKGTLLSKLVFDTDQPTTDVSGLMNWFKRTQVAKYFPGGFTNESMIVGSRFIAPTGTNRLLALSTAVAGFTNGNLVADFANDVTVDAAGKVTNQDLNKLKLSLSRSSGLMSGSVTPPGATKAIPFKGAILQKQNRGSGYFLNGTNASGRVSLDE
jgi:hypothetical protein